MVLIWMLVTGAALVGAAPEFEAATLDGRTAVGKLVALDGQQAVLQTENGDSAFALESLATLSRQNDTVHPAAKSSSWVELVDDSGLAAVEYLTKEGTAAVTLTNGDKLEIPTRAIRWVRFASPTDDDGKLTKQWSEITHSAAAGDLVVVRKEEALDFLEGVVRDLTAETCDFEFEGETIAVKRGKLAGLIYFRTAAADLAEPLGQVMTRDGSRLAIASAALEDGRLKMATPGGVALTLPLDDITRLDFSTGKIAYLSDLDPQRVEYVPYFGLRQALPALADYYSYRRDSGFENQPLLLDGKTYRKGLAVQSRTTLAYRLPGKFRLFKAVVGIGDDVRATGDATLSIQADGKTLWQGELRGGEPAQELELELGGARRLEIVADYGPKQDVGDRINLCEARVTK
ncbi:MAG: NPCBM/NEW2 domain-containing protein [Pirellulales bacterium]